MLVYQYLSNRVDGLIDHIDEVGTEFIVQHARWDGHQQEAETYEVDPGAEPTPAPA